MKIKFFVAVTALLCAVGLPSVYAQFVGGAALIYSTDIDEPGIQINGYYNLAQVDPKLSVGADLSFYLPHKYTGWKESFWELNINGHYSLYNKEKVNIYGLAGLNITAWKIKDTDPEFGRYSASGSNGGLNIGAGAQTGVGFGDVFGELKYVINDLDHLMIAAGVRIPL